MEELCQSCGIKLDPGFYGTNIDDTINNEYCKYCFEKGIFREHNITFEEMLGRRAADLVDNLDIRQEDAEELALKIIPNLKRWKIKQ